MDANDRDMPTQFALECNFDRARQCMCDALFIANEREYHGIVTLISSALDDLNSIWRLARIIPQPLNYRGPVVEEEARNG